MTMETKISNSLMFDNFGRLFTNVVIRVWFTCLLKNREFLAPLATLVFHMITSGHANIVKKTRDVRENTC